MSTATTLVGLAREAVTLATSRRPDPDAALDLADRVEAFATDHPNLDPETHRRLLVQAARNLDPTCPATIPAARALLAGTRAHPAGRAARVIGQAGYGRALAAETTAVTEALEPGSELR